MGFVASGLDGLAGLDDAYLRATWTLVAEEMEREGLNLQNASAHPAIAAWRSAMVAQGLKPSTYRSSVEALVRRVFKDGALRTPFPLVDSYCAASVKHLAPLGAYDIARLPERALMLRHGQPAADRFEPLGGRREDMPINDDVVIYAAGNTVICWAFNHRDSRETSLLSSTKSAVFLGESVTQDGRARTASALKELASLVVASGGRAGPTALCDANRPSMRLTLESDWDETISGMGSR